jgi:carboxypeptidase family protein
MKTRRIRGFSVLLAVGMTWLMTSRAVDSRADDTTDGVNIVGTVSDDAGHPVSGAGIELIDASGQVTAKATTGPDGGYEMPCVATGQYQLRLAPGTTGVQGDTVAAPVGVDGLVVNWTVSRSAPPLAAALASGGSCAPRAVGAASPASAELPPAVVVGGGGAIVVGGTLGGLAASGAFDGSNRSSSTASR